jgi:hypothetical protein
MRQNLNPYNPVQFKKQFESTEIYHSVAEDFDNICNNMIIQLNGRTTINQDEFDKAQLRTAQSKPILLAIEMMVFSAIVKSEKSLAVYCCSQVWKCVSDSIVCFRILPWYLIHVAWYRHSVPGAYAPVRLKKLAKQTD